VDVELKLREMELKLQAVEKELAHEKDLNVVKDKDRELSKEREQKVQKEKAL
jgi:hypothetical protein